MRVLQGAVALGNDPTTALRNIKSYPIRSFERKTALDMDEDGRTDVVVAYLQSLSAGYVGLTNDPVKLERSATTRGCNPNSWAEQGPEHRDPHPAPPTWLAGMRCTGMRHAVRRRRYMCRISGHSQIMRRHLGRGRTSFETPHGVSATSLGSALARTAASRCGRAFSRSAIAARVRIESILGGRVGRAQHLHGRTQGVILFAA